MAFTKFYAYYIDEKRNGITTSWPECQKATHKVKGAKFKSFGTKHLAEIFIKNKGEYSQKITSIIKGIYFDAGTGRGIGVETRVTDETGTSIMHEYVPPHKINEFGNYLCKPDSTNNYGELMGLFIALNIAMRRKTLKIIGDSKLVVDYWSKGNANKDKLHVDTVDLIHRVKRLRNDYENMGGEIILISGDTNPADLGFHK